MSAHMDDTDRWASNSMKNANSQTKMAMLAAGHHASEYRFVGRGRKNRFVTAWGAVTKGTANGDRTHSSKRASRARVKDLFDFMPCVL